MKNLYLLILAIGLVACAPPPPPTCTITWSCSSGYCAAEEGAWSGTSTFTGQNDQEDCIAWGTAFRYTGGHTSNCSCTN